MILTKQDGWAAIKMLKFNYSINGKIMSFGVVLTHHAKEREIERAHACSFEKIGQTLMKGLPDVVRIATLNNNQKDQKDLILINESLGHSIALKIKREGKIFVIVMKTVIDEAKNLWVSKKHSETSEIVRV